MTDPAEQERGLLNTDAALVDACRRNEPGAWARLVKRFERLIFTVPRRAGLSQDEAADVFQNVFMRLHEHIGSLQQTDRLQAWLVTTARRETLRHLEQRRRFPGQMPALDAGEDADAYALDQALVDPDPLPEEVLDELQQRHRARLALESLGEPCAGLLKLLYMTEEPVPYADISVRLGMPVGSIGPTRARCLGKLRERLGG